MGTALRRADSRKPLWKGSSVLVIPKLSPVEAKTDDSRCCVSAPQTEIDQFLNTPIKQRKASLMDSPALPRPYLPLPDTLSLRNSCVIEASACSRPGTADAAWAVGQRTAWAAGKPHPAQWQAHPPHRTRRFWLRPRGRNSPLPGSPGQCHRLGTPTSRATSQPDCEFWGPLGCNPTDAAGVWKCCPCRKTPRTPVARKKSHHRNIPLPTASVREAPLED